MNVFYSLILLIKICSTHYIGSRSHSLCTSHDCKVCQALSNRDMCLVGLDLHRHTVGLVWR